MDREAGGSGKGNVKEEKREEYQILTTRYYYAIALLMSALEKTLDIPIKIYMSAVVFNELGLKMEEFNENDNLFRLRKDWPNNFYGPGKYPKLDAEYEKLFAEWKKDTPQ